MSKTTEAASILDSLPEEVQDRVLEMLRNVMALSSSLSRTGEEVYPREAVVERLTDLLWEILRNLAEDADDEARWEALFARKKAELIATARRARKDVAAGRATEMDYDKL